jgi:hypothetical protein
MNFSPLGLALILLLPGNSFGQSAGSSVPAELESTDRPAAWVAADVAITRDGNVRNDKLKVYAPLLERDLAKAKQPRKSGRAYPHDTTTERCVHTISPIPNWDGADATPQELIERSKTIIRGRITAVREGFYHGMPGSLVRLNGTYLRGARTNEVYLFYPSADIATAEGIVCSRPPQRYGPPVVGDELIVFDPMASPVVIDKRTVLWVRLDHHIVYLPKTGPPVLPEALFGFAANDDPVEAILALIRQAPSNGIVKDPTP